MVVHPTSHRYVGMHQPVDMEGLKHTLHIHRLGAEPFPKSSSICEHVGEARACHNSVPVGYMSSLQLDECPSDCMDHKLLFELSGERSTAEQSG